MKRLTNDNKRKNKFGREKISKIKIEKQINNYK